VDTFAKRLEHMKDKIFRWSIVVDEWRRVNKSRMVMIMLSYRKAEDYRPGHIGDYLRNVKKRLGKNLYAFAWVAELQRREAVHYHLILLVEPHTDIPMPDKHGYWTHGHSKIETARTAFYLAKYVGKEYQKDLAKYPKSCRLCEVSIRPSMSIYRSWRENLQYKKPIKIRTAEGAARWEFVGAAVGQRGAEYLRAIAEG
jgi:hypothetical protein